LGPARCGSLRKAYPRCGKLGATVVQERVERRYRGCGTGVQTAGAVPVDLAATASVERRGVCSGWVRPTRAGIRDRDLDVLNRVNGWPGRLEHSRRNKVLGCFALRVRGPVNWDQQRHEQQANREYVT